MTEIDVLNKAEDDYADSLFCASCPLPELVRTYEVGFQLLQQQLVELRGDLKKMAERIDTIDDRAVRKANR